MKIKGILTPVLKYWNLSEHPFNDFILKELELSLFVDREDEISSFHNSLNNRLIAVYGSQGVGKSSFLRKAKQAFENADTPVVYIQMYGTTENALYREILAGILKAIDNGKITIAKNVKIHAKQELERLEKSIRFARETSVGANLIGTASIKETKQSDMHQHTEETACKIIHEIIKHKQTPFVVIIDDLERVKLFMPENDQYSRFISGFARTVDESFSDQGVCFAISLDEGFVAKIDKNLPADEGAISFSFGDLIRIPTFTPSHVLEIIGVRLKSAGWKKPIFDFISEEAFWCLCVGTSGHPRRFLAVLRSAMEIVSNLKAPHVVDKKIIMDAIGKRNEKVDEKDLKIISYLFKNGQSSPSDENMQKHVGLSRIGLSDRIKSLKTKVHLEDSRLPIGKTFKDVYSLQKLRC